MHVVVVGDSGQVRVGLDGLAVLLEQLVALVFGQPAQLLLAGLALLAHQHLLELLRQDVQVAGQQREQVGVVEVEVRVGTVLLVCAGQTHVHCERHVFAQH